MTDIEIRPGVKVLLFDRSDGPYFALREFDTKILRVSTSKKHALRVHNASEQAIRARITQVIMKMKLNALKGLKDEIEVLKKRGILGKRAPKCSMLNSTDTIRLLKAFGCESYANDLERVLKDRGVDVEIPDESYPLDSPTSDHEQSTPKFRPDDTPHIGAPASVKRLLRFPTSPGSSNSPRRAKRAKVDRAGSHRDQSSRGSIAHGSFLWNGVRVQKGEDEMPRLILPHAIGVHIDTAETSSGNSSPRSVSDRSTSPDPQAFSPSTLSPAPDTATAHPLAWSTQIPSIIPAKYFASFTSTSASTESANASSTSAPTTGAYGDYSPLNAISFILANSSGSSVPSLATSGSASAASTSVSVSVPSSSSSPVRDTVLYTGSLLSPLPGQAEEVESGWQKFVE